MRELCKQGAWKTQMDEGGEAMSFFDRFRTLRKQFSNELM